MLKTVLPKDKEEWLRLRLDVITSTEVSSLFGINPYCTSYELWHRKKNKTIVELEPSQRMLWGQRLESAIANGVAEDNGLTVKPMKEFMWDDTWRIGSSFDFSIDPDGLLEVKNVDSLAYKEGWLINGESIEAPPFIELQAQNEMLVSGKKYIMLAALVGGNRVTLIRREPDLEIQQAIKAKVAEFWNSIDENREPAPDFKSDADFIKSMMSYAEPGKIIQGTEEILDLAMKYKAYKEVAKVAGEDADGVKAHLLTLIGDAEKVVHDKFTISANLVGETLIEAFTKKAFRSFRIYLKKEKP